MKIVNRKDFLKYPNGTIYCSFNKNSFEFNGFVLKLDSLENDWYYMDLTDFDNWENSDEREQNVRKMLTEAKEYPMLLNCSSRDGMFDEEDMFCIYDKTDIKKLIEVLKESIE